MDTEEEKVDKPLDQIPTATTLATWDRESAELAAHKAAQSALKARIATLGPQEAQRRVTAAGIAPVSRAMASRMTTTQQTAACQDLLAALA